MSLVLYGKDDVTIWDDSAAGESIRLTNSIDKNLAGLALYGKTTQNGTPTPENPVELVSVGDDGSVDVIVCGKNLLAYPYDTENTKMSFGTVSGLTVIDNFDGSVTLNGTTTARRYFRFGDFRFYKAGTYVFSLNTDNTQIYGGFITEDGKAAYIDSTHRTAKLTVTEDSNIRAYLSINAETKIDNVVVRPQVERNDVATAYEPYNGQHLTVQTPNGLPGIPVSSGGNYTDENGQQWICDEIDFARGVYVQRVAKRVFKGTENMQAGTVIGNYVRTGANFSGLGLDGTYRHGGLYTHGDFKAGWELNTPHAYVHDHIVWLFLSIASTDASDIKAYLSEQYMNGTPVSVLYELVAPIETDLSAEELSAYAALHTNYPNTTIYTDSNAVLKVNYYAEKRRPTRYEVANATAVQMSVYYNDIGKLILDVPINDDNVEALKNDHILYDTGKKLAYIIKNVKTDTKANRITANGYTTNQILNGRIIAAPVAFTKVEDGVYSVVNDNLRGMSRVSTAAHKGLTERTNLTLFGEGVLDKIIPVLSNAELGHRMNWNHRTQEHTFEVYKGEDLTTGLRAVVFSDEQGTARDLVITDDASEFKNVVYVVAEYNETQIVEVVGTDTGDNRHEMWLEVSLTQEEGETEAHFRARMQNHGAMELGKQIRGLSFTVTIDPAELGVMYNIGDLVACVSKRFGVRFNARITGAKFKKDSKGETTEIILGEPILTKIGEVIVSG